MPKTAVGLFENPGLVDVIVREIEALGFPRKEVRELEEPATFDVTGVMSFPRLDFEAGFAGLRRGGALVFATGSPEMVDAAAAIMNRYGALEVEAASGAEPHLPGVAREGIAPTGDSTVQTGRVREPSGSASCFVW
jgi:hypothetical protein